MASIFLCGGRGESRVVTFVNLSRLAVQRLYNKYLTVFQPDWGKGQGAIYHTNDKRSSTIQSANEQNLGTIQHANETRYRQNFVGGR